MALIYDPHMDWEVHDESTVEGEDETPALDTALGVLFAGFSSRGIKNEIIECKSPAALKTTFGDDFVNWKKYGQTNHEAMRAALNGARVFFCSLVPENANIAYIVFGVTVKEEHNIPVYKRRDTRISADGTTVLDLGQGGFVYDSNNQKIPVTVTRSETDESSGESTTVSEAVTVDGVSLKVEAKRLNNVTFDVNGDIVFVGEPVETVDSETGVTETFYPLFAQYYYSRGKGGNYFGFKMNKNSSRDKKATDGRRFTMIFYEILSGGNYKKLYDGETFDFSFNPDAVYSSIDTSSEALSQIYTNLDDSSEKKPLQMVVYEDNFEKLIADIEAKGGVEEENSVEVDFLEAKFKNGNPYNKIVLDPTSLDISNMIVTLEGGDDGGIQVGNVVDGVTVTEEMAEKTKEDLLVNFFNCDVDDDIFDEKITDIDVLPDCNYSDNVKTTILSEFTQYRPDIKIAIDLGFNNYKAEAVSKFNELRSYVGDNPYMVSFFAQYGYLNDSGVDKTPRLITGVYDWIGGLAKEFAQPNGAFQMHAGSKHGRVRYIKPMWIAKKNKANDLEELDELGINTIQYLNKKKETVWFGETTQYNIEGSKLLSDRNAMVIGRLIRMCAGVLPYYKYDDQHIKDTLKDAKASLEANVGLARVPATIRVTFDMYQTKQDVKDENAHVAIDVYFPDYAKKFHVVITARRNSDNTTSATAA